MPFKSRSQQRYLFANRPDVAEDFAAHTPKKAYKTLPEHVEKQSKNAHMKKLSNQYMRSKSVK